MVISELARPLLANGYEPLPITPGSKAPEIRSWTLIDIDESTVESWEARQKGGDYVGLRCGTIVAVDIDIDNADVTADVLSDLEFSLGSAPVRRGKPGRALAMFKAAGRWPKKTLKLVDPEGAEHAIEVLASGQQFVAFGIHASTGREYSWEGGSPRDTAVDSLTEVSEAELVDWLSGVEALLPNGWAVAPGSVFDEDERFLLTFRPSRDESEMSLDELTDHRALLSLEAWVPDVLPGAREYRDGYRISSKALGRDLQEDLQIDPAGVYDFGEEAASSASAVVAKYRFEGDITAAREWLRNRLGIDAEQHQAVVEQARADECRYVMWSEHIAKAVGDDRLQKLLGPIGRDAALSPLDRERLVAEWQARFQEVTGQRIGVAVIRQMMAPNRPSGDPEAPEWSEGWYYVTHVDKFFRHGTQRWVTAQGFNALYQRELAPDDSGGRPMASRVALDEFHVPVVDIAMYAPHLGEAFVMSGQKCVNLFMPDSIPEPDPVLSDAGQETVDALLRHIRLICNGRDAITRALVDWLAHNVQRPGIKIRFAPLICGIEGDGKSMLLSLLALCLGEPNVRSVSPQVLMSQFNGYAVGRAVVGLEEVRIAGHNRHDAMNAVKPAITNDHLDIHKKGQDSYNALNVTNYIGFTNYRDALPLDENDRRWMVVFTPWADREGMRETIGEDPLSYFDKLHDLIQANPGAVRHWLHNHKISDGFNRHGPAPYTSEKASMAAAERSDDAEDLAALLSEGGVGFNSRILSTQHLSEALHARLAFDDDAFIPKGRGLATLLKKAGWTKLPKQVKWDGVPCRLWYRGRPFADNDEVREALNQTLADAPGGGSGETIPF